MTFTPLCNKFTRLSLSPDNEASVTRYSARAAKRVCHSSPEIFSSALRPLFPDRSQSVVIRARAYPARSRQEITLLTVRPFRLAPKNPPTGPVEFKDIPRSSGADPTSLSEDGVFKIRLFRRHPNFCYALAEHEFKKLMQPRTTRHLPRFLRPRLRNARVVHNATFTTKSDRLVQKPSIPFNTKPHVAHNTTPITKYDRLVPKPSIPFNENTDLDPFMLFPEKQWPFSALRNDSRRYREEREAVLEEKAQRYLCCTRRGEMTVEESKDMIQMTYGIGKYASPQRQSIEELEEMAYWPMDIDW